jgi:hypothetical protein
MGWQTDLFCNITFNRETFNSKYDVENKIEEETRTLNYAKNRLRNLVYMTEPNKFCPPEQDTIIFVENEFNDTLETIEECTSNLVKLYILLDNWDYCHDKNGLAINPPDSITWKTAYLDGDFVKTVKRPDANECL